jgi:DNA-directed RNA polymerase subunit RPC12/RpoP
MIVRDGSSSTAEWKLHYDVSVKDNSAYMDLSEVEYRCNRCSKNAYIDLSIVPVQCLEINCDACGNDIMVIEEGEFQYFLQPVGEHK